MISYKIWATVTVAFFFNLIKWVLFYYKSVAYAIKE